MTPNSEQPHSVDSLYRPLFYWSFNERLGVGYGLYDFVENLGFAIGPLLGGFVYDTVGKGAPFYLNGAILILSAGWVLLFLRRAPVPSPETSLQE